MPKLLLLVAILFVVVIGVTTLGIALANFIEKVRRRRKAHMEDGIIGFDDWKHGDPNQKVPDNALRWDPLAPDDSCCMPIRREVKFNPDDF